MGRPKKNISTPIEQKTITQTTEQKIENIKNRWNEIFSNFSNVDYIAAMQTWYTSNPYVQNDRLKNLKTNPVFVDRETLESSLQSPQNNERSLRQMSWSLLANTYPYYKILRMYADILTYKHYAYPKFVTKEEMDTPRFKSDSKIVSMLIDKIQPEYNFRRIVLETMIEGKRAYTVRIKVDTTTGKENVSHFLLQELPSNWWRPVAKSDASYYVPSFDFTYFWQAGTSIKQFPPEFAKYYEELMFVSIKDKNGNWDLDENKMPDLKEKGFLYENKGGKWYLWHEIEDGFVFSADESNAWMSPTFTGLFLAGQDLQSYYTLQTQLASIPLYGLVTGEIPLADENKTGNYVNDMRLSPDVVVGLTNQATSILPPGVSFYAAPFQNMKFEQFEEQVNSSKIYTDALQQFLGSSGTTGLVSTSNKPSVAQVKAAEKIESRYADVFYGQFENFMNIVFSKYVKLSFVWNFKIFGDVFSDEDRTQRLKDGLSMGIIQLMPEYLAMSNLDMESATAIGNWVDSTGLYDQMKSLTSTFNSKSQSGTNGRPAKPDSEVDNDSTAASKDGGQNTSKNRSFDLSDTQMETIAELVLDMTEGNQS